MTPIVVSLADLTGRAVEPWAEAGFECYCVDIQHSIRRERREGNINYVWGDVRSWCPPEGTRPVFLCAFTPCTHVANSGARDFKTKGIPMLCDALDLFNHAVKSARWAGCPWYAENPSGVITTHYRGPDYTFDPCDYAGYLPDPEEEAYTKETWIWAGGGFVMPEPKPVAPSLGSMMHRLPPSDDRADLRSATPKGWARAVFQANCPAGVLT
jgi:hypothetical protein